ncbi:hypothetical protein B0H21DRAFT_821302 [Amylocystis lapponica]|nr:hypothetical protein B0H21DRAFT_821302 [Amylocystis lapponica]
MAPPDAAMAHRPTMRRKSSAQNLLSSFKSTNSASTPSLQSSSVSITSATGLLQYNPSPPTAPMPREWDVQSQGSEPTAPNGNGAVSAQDTSVEMLREVVKKRIITLTYLRNVHEGRSHWFHTIMITRAELDRVFTNVAMRNRTYRFAMLGMALAHLFDIKEPTDLLRSLSNALNEYESSKEDSDRPRISQRFFRRNGRQRQPGTADYAISYTDASETSYMTLPHIPFPMDYQQTLLSLLDVLSEVYNKISKILGPSPFSSSGAHMMGPLGLLSPHPGVSYLFTGADAAPVHDGEGSLWGIANASGSGLGGGGGTALYGGALGSPPPSWNSQQADMVRQIDNKLKKLIATLLKELDDCARAGIRDELASLDPLLRNASVAEDVREQYEFET